jgi:hypothetical protein
MIMEILLAILDVAGAGIILLGIQLLIEYRKLRKSHKRMRESLEKAIAIYTHTSAQEP